MLYTETWFWRVLFIGSLIIEIASQQCKTTGKLLLSVRDSGFTSTLSERYQNDDPAEARLSSEKAWTTWGHHQWIQVKFNEPMIITAIITRGSTVGWHHWHAWVSSYRFSYSNSDCSNASFTHFQEFHANRDAVSLAKRDLETPVVAKCVRLHPTSWFLYFPALQFDVEGCPAIASRDLLPGVKNSALTASSAIDSSHGPDRARLHTEGAWVPRTVHNPWIQVEFEKRRYITAVKTQGRSEYAQWVKNYTLSYSIDCSAASFQYYLEENDCVFKGNWDRNTVIRGNVSIPVVAKCVRILPLTWHVQLSLRFSLEGCTANANRECEVLEVHDLLTDVPDSALTASSIYTNRHGPDRARLNTVRVGDKMGAWSPNKAGNNHWIQVEFERQMIITSIKTQGRSDYDQWVLTYGMAYSTDCKTFETYRKKRIFSGNGNNRNSVEQRDLKEPVWAKCVRLIPIKWFEYPSLRFDLEGSSADCYDNLLPGVEDSAFTASSVLNINHRADRARLYTEREGEARKAWCANGATMGNQWIQVTFSKLKTIKTIVTQGRTADEQWVSTYKMSYSTSDDCNSASFKYYSDKVFKGNVDSTSLVRNTLATPVVAKCVRLHPVSWNNYVCCRFDLEGCLAGCRDNLLPEVQDSALTASSEYDQYHGPDRARLHTKKDNLMSGAWTPAGGRTENSWIQVQFDDLKSITAVKTQGRSDDFQYVATYEMSYSLTECNPRSLNRYRSTKVFNGNRDRNSVVENDLQVSVVAKCVRLHPKAWNNYPCLRFEVQGCPPSNFSLLDNRCATTTDLVSEACDSDLTASSVHDSYHGPDRARLHTQSEGVKMDSWCSSRITYHNQWIQVEFDKLYVITKVKTQGRNDHPNWVTAYELSHSGDCTTFTPYTEPKVFRGNRDHSSVVRHELSTPLQAKCVRLHPKSFRGNPSLRFDLEGCSAKDES